MGEMNPPPHPTPIIITMIFFFKWTMYIRRKYDIGHLVHRD